MLTQDGGVLLGRTIAGQQERRVYFTPDKGATLIDWERVAFAGWIERRRFKLHETELTALYREMQRLVAESRIGGDGHPIAIGLPFPEQ